MHSRLIDTRNRAFSLVELSIVLVILGLLTGGILAGKSLIRASELRSVTADLNRYRTAFFAFRDKYFAYPGDMNNATSFWGSAGGTGSNRACFDSTTGTGTQTCNGNGDFFLQSYYTPDGGSTMYYASEALRAWQHLANAGMIEGTYNGMAYSTIRFGTNAPASKLGKSGYAFAYPDNNYDLTTFNTSQVVNTLLFGGQSVTANGAVLKPEEAWNIDSKMDDGNPSIGKIYVDPDQATCFTGATPSTTYALTLTSNACSLRMLLL